MTKLTLSIDEAVVQKAKRIADENKTSVSAMFSQFVLSLDAQRSRRVAGAFRGLTRDLVLSSASSIFHLNKGLAIEEPYQESHT